MKKALSVLLTVGLMATLTACGNSGNVMPDYPVDDDNEIVYDEPVVDEDTTYVQDTGENYDENFNENFDENAVSDPVAASDEFVIDDFKDAQQLWYLYEGGAAQDYEDGITADLNGYDMEFYRVTEEGFTTYEEMVDTMSALVDRSYVESIVSADGRFVEQDGVLYACPAGRGDDMTIGWVDFEVYNDGNVGVLTVNIHRQDWFDDLQDWFETGLVDSYQYPFVVENGHAVFDTMDYLCGSYPEEQPIEGHDIETYNALMEGQG